MSSFQYQNKLSAPKAVTLVASSQHLTADDMQKLAFYSSSVGKILGIQPVLWEKQNTKVITLTSFIQIFNKINPLTKSNRKVCGGGWQGSALSDTRRHILQGQGQLEMMKLECV